MPLILVVDDNQELLVLMTRLFEQAGYQVISASRGKQGVESGRLKAPELAVIDILLPDMMGQQVAEALRQDNPKIPLIFVTGVFKAGRHAIDARNKFGPVGYFEKPFEGEQLLEAVRKILPIEKPIAEVAEDPFDVDLDVSVQEDDPSQNTMELTGVIKVTGGDNLVAEIRGENFSASRVSPTTSGRALSPAAPPTTAPAQFAAGAPHQRGQLQDNLPSLITAFYLSGQTGELGVQRGTVKKVIYFHRGQPAFAMSNLLSERFGQFLARVGKVKPEQLQEIIAAAKSTQRRTGDVLIERGLLKDTERLYYVGHQAGRAPGNDDLAGHQEVLQARAAAPAAAAAGSPHALASAGLSIARASAPELGGRASGQDRWLAPGEPAGGAVAPGAADRPRIPLLDGRVEHPRAKELTSPISVR